VHVVDVRRADELAGDLGALAGVQNIPLDELRARVAEVARDRPVIVVCQTGRRSAMGAQILGEAGVAQVANLTGGMVRWRELGLPTG